MSQQPSWDKYEIVLLADAYLKIKNDCQMKLPVLQELSNTRLQTSIDIAYVVLAKCVRLYLHKWDLWIKNMKGRTSLISR